VSTGVGRLPSLRGPVAFATRPRVARWILLAPALLTLMALTIYPLLWTVRASVSAFTFGRLTSFIGLDNYERLFTEDRFWAALGVTATYTLAAVSLELLIGLGLAMLMDRKLAGRSVFRSLLIAPMMVAPVVAGVVWRLMYDPRVGILPFLSSKGGLGRPTFLADTSLALPSVILVDVWQWTPFMFLILLAGLQARPTDPYEAARVDGASGWQIFRDLTLPFLRNAILVAVLLRTIDAFRVFDQVVVLTNGGPGSSTETVSLLLYKQAFKFQDFGLAAAGIFVLMVVVTVVSMAYMRLMGERQEVA
jgi:multiple sugar transport system permease protein